MSLWSRIWRRRKIESPQELAVLLATEADELTQRTIVHYAQALMGREWRKLVATEEFRIAMYRSRWESYPAILGDLVCIVEAFLRKAAPVDANERAVLFQRLFSEALAVRPIPREHLDDARLAMERFPTELGRRLLAEPQRSDRIALSGGNFLFDHLPVHESARQSHKLPVVNAVRFAMVGFRDGLERKIANPAALLHQLSSGLPVSRDRTSEPPMP
jgi:hypothetical protein